MLHLDDARGRLAGRVIPLRSLTVPLSRALGCRLTVAAVSDTDLPPFDTSAMDGYAVRTADLVAGQPLPIVFEIPAGQVPPALPEHSAARIFTGAPLPAGADAVVPQEDAERLSGDTVRLAPVASGSYVRYRGEVIARGHEVAGPGDRVSPQRLALLAAAGCAAVTVVPRPRVAVLVTGAELLAITDPPLPGRIRNSNGPMLEALAAEASLPIVASDLAGDDLETLRRRLAELAAAADLVVTSGGVSVGDYDLVPAALEALAAEVLVHGVAIRPGKPVLVARLGSSWVVGLPGNPMSVLVGWRMFVRPLAEALSGDGLAFGETPLSATLTGSTHNPGPRTQLRPAILDPAGAGFSAAPIPWHGSHDVAAAAAANALVRIEPGAELAPGAVVPAYPLPWALTE